MVSISNDYEHETDESFNVSLSSPSGATISQGSAAVTITDDDEASRARFTSTSVTVKETDKVATLSISREGGSGDVLSASYTTSGGSATAGSDYGATSGSLQWGAGDVQPKQFTLPIMEDNENETAETITVTLKDAIGQVVDTATVTITDVPKPGVPKFTAPNVTVNESSGNATMTVRREGGNSGELSVTYRTSDGTAKAGSDYQSVNGTLLWGANDSQDKQFTVPIWSDLDNNEPNETVTLTLTDAQGQAIDTATLTISNVSQPVGAPQFTSSNITVNEHDSVARITVNRVNGQAGELSVKCVTRAGTAIVGKDYSEASGCGLTWASGDTSAKVFDVTILNDTEVDGNNTVHLELLEPRNNTVLATALLTIVDDDKADDNKTVPGNVKFQEETYKVSEADKEARLILTRDSGNAPVSVHG
jgi:hypothetical protein